MTLNILKTTVLDQDDKHFSEKCLIANILSFADHILSQLYDSYSTLLL